MHLFATELLDEHLAHVAEWWQTVSSCDRNNVVFELARQCQPEVISRLADEFSFNVARAFTTELSR
jgi:hypothetical protein